MKLNSEMSLLKTSDETYLHDQHKKIKQEKKKTLTLSASNAINEI